MGSAVCHRMAERSLFFDGMQMPLCARCTGIYTGVFFAFCFFFLKKRMQGGKPFSMAQILLTAAAILPVGIDGVGSYLGFWESSQWMRICSGALVGAIVPGLLLLAGNLDPKKENVHPVYEKTAEILLLTAISLGFGFCLLAGVPVGAVGALLSVAGEVLFWGGVIWLLLKQFLKGMWSVSLLLSFVGLFLIGGMVS